jgi:hypothetical protein
MTSAAAPAQAAGTGRLLGLLAGTPFWVYPLLALLIYPGARAIRRRVMRWPRAVIVAAIFISWGVVSVVARPDLSPALGDAWLIAAVGAGILALMTVRFAGLRVDREQGLVDLPGSALPFARNLPIFAAKYGIAVPTARHPDMHDDLAFWDIAVSGAGAGYFLGWAWRFAAEYRRAPGTALATDIRS